MTSITGAMTDPNLFGDTYGGDSFASWRALLAGFYGLTMTTDALAAFHAITCRQTAPTEPHNELWLAVGRRGGKSHCAALCAVYEAAFRDHRSKLAPGEVATVMLIAADRQQARTLMRYVRGLFENPLLKKMVRSETADTISLVNRSAIEIHTASHKAVRGYTLASVICDEIAFWSSEGTSPDAEVIAALRPALATLDGKLICISSPYARRGMLWTQYSRYFGKENDRILVAQAPTLTMNPTLPQRVVADALKDDAARASAEYLAQFRSDIEQFISLDAVTDAQRLKPLELPRVAGLTYTAFCDMSGGGADEHVLAIGHRDGARLIIDVVQARKGNPEFAVASFTEALKAYCVRTVSGDRYAGQWVPTAFRRHGIRYDPAPGARSELYATFASALNAGQVELPPCEILARQLGSLERRTSRGGRDIIDHAPGAHDDRANAAAGVVTMLAAQSQSVPRIRFL